MARASRIGEFDYVLKEDRDLDESEQTVFHLRTLSYDESEAVANAARVREDGIDLGSMLTSARRALNFGLLGWENFPDDDGKDAPFSATGKGLRRRLSEKTLTAVRKHAIEIAEAITNGSELSEDEQKNS